MLVSRVQIFNLFRVSHTKLTWFRCKTYTASVDIVSFDATYSLDRGLPMGSPKAAAGPLKQKIGSPKGRPQFRLTVRFAPACRGFVRVPSGREGRGR